MTAKGARKSDALETARDYEEGCGEALVTAIVTATATGGIR